MTAYLKTVQIVIVFRGCLIYVIKYVKIVNYSDVCVQKSWKCILTTSLLRDHFRIGFARWIYRCGALLCIFLRPPLHPQASFVAVDKIKQKSYVTRRIHAVPNFSEFVPVICCLSIMCPYNTIDWCVLSVRRYALMISMIKSCIFVELKLHRFSFSDF